MSYKEPAPFQTLKSHANGILHSVAALESHPEGKQAFIAWMEEFEFTDRFTVRYKDLPVDTEVGEVMVLTQCTFFCELGTLTVEYGYSRYIWNGSKWESDPDS